VTTKHVSIEPVVPLLREHGFKKRLSYTFTLDLAPDIVGWLGLNQATEHRYPREVEINPVIGVRFQAVERLVAECRGEKFHSYVPPTISKPLGYLMPERTYKGWLLGPGHSEQVAIDMVNAIASHGVAFMRSVGDLAELRRYLERGFAPLEEQLAQRRPAAALLAGDVEQARALMDAAVTALGTRTNGAAAELRAFAEAFRRHLPS
jgi:hypothetical protein